MGFEELIERLIDSVEDFLWCRQVDLRNTEPRPDNDDGETVIYGRDRQTLFDDFYDIFEEVFDYGLV